MAQPGFQTTFIPKRDNASGRKRRNVGGGVFTAVGVVVLVCTVLVAFGFFSYAKVIEGSIQSKKDSLELSQDKFEPGLIQLLANLDFRLGHATDLLEDHVAASKMFRPVEEITLRSVQFTDFNYSLNEQAGFVDLTMNGVARSYAAAALQSDEFAASDTFKNTLFSGLRVDEKTGEIRFSVDTSLDLSLVSFVDTLVDAGLGDATATFGTGTAPVVPVPISDTPEPANPDAPSFDSDIEIGINPADEIGLGDPTPPQL